MHDVANDVMDTKFSTHQAHEVALCCQAQRGLNSVNDRVRPAAARVAAEEQLERDEHRPAAHKDPPGDPAVGML